MRHSVLVPNCRPRPAWCCPTFEGLVDGAGQRGMSIFVATIAERDCFILQARALDDGEDLSLSRSASLSVSVPITLVEDMVISHCPACGSALHQYYMGRLDVLRREDLRVQIS